MKKLFDTLTNPRSIQWIIFAIVVGVIAVIIFMIVFIFSPTLQNIFTRARETLLTLLTAAMVLATLILALGTFKIINEERFREERSRKERYLDEIISWVIQVNKSCIPPSGSGREAYMEWCRGITSSIASEGKWALRSSSIFGSEFNNNMNNLLNKISNLNDCIRTFTESNKYTNKQVKEILSEPFVNLLEATDKVLDEALKIKADEKF